MAKPLEEEYGGLVGSSKPKKGGGRGGAAPLAPTGPRPVPAAPPGGSGGSTTSDRTGSAGSSGSGRSSGSSGGGSSSWAKSVARDNAQRLDAADRYIRNAETLEAQAKALQHAIRKDFTRRRDQQLGDIVQQMRQQKGLLREGFRRRADSLKGAAEDNEKAEAGQSGINAGNLLRERGDAMAEIAALGAGGSDALQAQLMSLRNWQANQTEVSRGYFDTLRSINSSLTDLEVDTKTALANAEIEANADREQVWTDFFNQTSEAQTQLGNVRGQQADLYNQAAEYGRESALGKKGRDKDKKGGEPKKGDGKPQGKKGGPPTPAERNDRIRPGSNADRQPGRPARREQAPERKPGTLPLGERRDILRTAIQREVLENRHDGDRYKELSEREQRRVDNRVDNQFERARGRVRNTSDDVQERFGNLAAGAKKERAREARRAQARADRRFINRTADNAAEADRQSRNAFLNASKTAGKSWDNPGVSKGVMEWDGRPEFEEKPTTMSKIQAARTVSLGKQPEGATLRKW